jgi:hypothetical protein
VNEREKLARGRMVERVCVASRAARKMETLWRVATHLPSPPSKPQAQKLSEDHRFDSSPSERARVVALGGKFAHAADGHGKPCGPLRLWPGGVAQARTVGDSDVGGFISATPYTATLDVPAGCAGGTVVLASDGVWDAFAPKVATQVSLRASGAQPLDRSHTRDDFRLAASPAVL